MNTSPILHDHIRDEAQRFAGNWKRFESFAWNRSWNGDVDEPDRWGIFYTHNRDSGLTDQSNADAIAKMLEPFTRGAHPSVLDESHGHWACGWVDGFAVKVFTKKGKLTKAFEKLCEIRDRLEDYPVLDEEDLSRRQHEAALEWIKQEARGVDIPDGYTLPEGFEADVAAWLDRHEPREMDDRDDTGPTPSEEAIQRAFVGCGFIPDPDTYPTYEDLITIDKYNFHLEGRDVGPVVYVPEGGDWKEHVREYQRENPGVGAWLITGQKLTDCQPLDTEE